MELNGGIMENFNVGDYKCDYQIIMVYTDNEKSLCIGSNGDNYAVFETDDDITIHAYTTLTREEADFLFFQKYKLHNDIKKDTLREECENEIAKYVFGTDDVNYKQAKILQAMFNIDKIIENYRKYNNNWELAIGIYIHDNEIYYKK